VRRWLPLLFGLGCAACAAAPPLPRPRAWDFQLDEPGGPAAGFVVPTAEGGGPAGRWAIDRDEAAPSPRAVVAQSATHHPAAHGALLVADTPPLADCRARVHLAPRADGRAQGGGLLLRYRDPRTHYVVRWDVAARRVVLERVAGGTRTVLGQASVAPPDLTVVPWHALTAVARGARLLVAFDEVPCLDLVDDAPLGRGQVGLWTPPGACTAFDDLSLEALAPPATPK
jgi:hypothetical protein